MSTDRPVGAVSPTQARCAPLKQGNGMVDKVEHGDPELQFQGLVGGAEREVLEDLKDLQELG